MLTIDELDPVGKIPEFKFCAVRIERASAADLGRGVDVGHGVDVGRGVDLGRE